MSEIIAVIVDQLPTCLSECDWCEIYMEQENSTDKYTYVVDCDLLNVRKFYASIDPDSERCPCCPLTTEEEYKAKLEERG